jgi:signal transduction histidine kinase
MIDPWTSKRIPLLMRERRWWFAPLALWALAVSVSLYQHLDDLERQGLHVASEGARNLFNMVVLTRAWNAGHGGVYVPVSDSAQPNPYLVHPRRDLVTQDGQRLTMINPAYMTRQISELAQKKGGTVFHITSLKPIRPLNAPDAWERDALLTFEQGKKEAITLLADASGPARLRYMAPLKVAPPCMVCHASQGYKVGDVRGGISVTVPFDPMRAISEPARRQSWTNHLSVFAVIALLGWALLELLRRRWHDLADNLTALESARNAMQAANAQLAQARDDAEAASRSKSAFLGAMSHELRTPLNGILGFAHLLQRTALPGKANEQVGRIAEQGGNLLALINEVMEFTRLESLERPEKVGVIDLTALLVELADELRRDGAAKGLRVSIDLASDLPARVAGEANWLSSCLRPMLKNAVKFTELGSVCLSARGQLNDGGGYRLQVTVSDTGIGIAEADLGKLFQPFRQIDDARTRRYGGLGLGLAISARYAALLGGHLSCESVAGAGSQFHLDWLTHTVTPVAEPVAIPVSDLAAADLAVLMAELAQLLAEDDLRTAAALKLAMPALSQAFDAVTLAELRLQVENFDYPAALDSVRAMQAQL